MSIFGLYVIRRWPSLRSRPWLEQFLRRAIENKNIVAIVAIGSAVRIRGHKRSDLDLLVLYCGERLKLRPPLEVDLRLYPAEKADRLAASGHEVVGWAIKFGFPLYDPTGAWESLSHSWVTRLPLPSATEAIERGDKSLKRAREMLRSGDEIAASDLLLGALTQFVRAELIRQGVYPASRPELPDQLRAASPGNGLAQLLEDAMYGETAPQDLIARLAAIKDATLHSKQILTSG